ncbi:hypothetical protein NEOLI_004293 [Neolecta irregularis DAH-3]|uniref:Uncharacterized protein n=1 Tax=Neolecta irregularis (strain DAH-3) TaxID=1198029 RepID=A0A1U7LU60_NEOID|nr:hypothetical protein NEOLI_004293 [Neolecta irregularis DAH-3]|eukprot:OLL26210.1 hypothetical protein NEOLI_004293 [Neolecta irregularis DAH-3]
MGQDTRDYIRQDTLEDFRQDIPDDIQQDILDDIRQDIPDRAETSLLPDTDPDTIDTPDISAADTKQTNLRGGGPLRHGSKRVVSTLELQTETMQAQLDNSDSDSFSSSDEEDEYRRQISRQRARHAARLDVYRQQIQRVTGLTTPRPPVFREEDSWCELKDDQQESIPLQVLKAHQFPREGRQRNIGELKSFASHPNLRNVPLPRDPYFGQCITSRSSARSSSAGNLLASIDEIGGKDQVETGPHDLSIGRMETPRIRMHDEIEGLKDRMKRETRYNLVQSAGRKSSLVPESVLNSDQDNAQQNLMLQQMVAQQIYLLNRIKQQTLEAPPPASLSGHSLLGQIPSGRPMSIRSFATDRSKLPGRYRPVSMVGGIREKVLEDETEEDAMWGVRPVRRLHSAGGKLFV